MIKFHFISFNFLLEIWDFNCTHFLLSTIIFILQNQHYLFLFWEILGPALSDCTIFCSVFPFYKTIGARRSYAALYPTNSGVNTSCKYKTFTVIVGGEMRNFIFCTFTIRVNCSQHRRSVGTLGGGGGRGSHKFHFLATFRSMSNFFLQRQIRQLL